MILDNVNIGLAPDDGTGDKLRNAFNIVNDNFDDLELKTQEIDEELLKKDLVNTGYIDGLHLSINTDDTKFNISAGNYVVNLDGDVSLLVFDELLALTPAYLTTANATYIGLNVNKQVIQQSSPFTNEQRRSICPIGAVIHSNRTIINTVNQIKAPLKYTLNQLHDVIEVLGSLNLEGNTYSPNGVNLQINKSAGTVFALGINSENPLNPHQLNISAQTGLTFRYRLQNGTEYLDRNTIDPINYDLNGVLTPLLNNNKWSVQHINLFQSGLTRIQYGQHQYNSLEEAEQKIKTETFITETNIADNAIFRCYLIVKKNATDLSNPSQAKFIPVDKWGNALSGGVAVTYDSIITALGYTPSDSSLFNSTTALTTQFIDSYNGTILKPLDTSINGFMIQKSINGNVGLQVVNTDTVGNASVASVTVRGSEDPYSNGLSFNYFNSNYFVPNLRNTGAVYSTVPLNIMSVNNHPINFRAGADINATTKFSISSTGVLNIAVAPNNGTSDDILIRNSNGNIETRSTTSIIDSKISKSIGTTYTTNSILTVTQAEYDTILVKDPTTLYFII